MLNPFDFSGKVAVITGAGRGIGRSTAIAFASLGANVLIASRTAAELENVANAIQSSGGVVEAIQADLGDPNASKELTDHCMDHFGRLDILVNNAGQVVRKRAEDTLPDDWDTVLDVNLKGMAEMCRHALPNLRRTSEGAIVNMSSITGLVGIPLRAAYAATKSAILGYTRVLAKELAPDGIRVNAVCPGFIDTAFVTPYLADKPDVMADILRHIPMGRVGRPEEAAWPIVFLASRAASYITGQAIVIDGGWMLF
jgi:NAD(P)-dependent dehydrogenase (short-subunit alcohol dehydrogenase family)